MSFRLPGNQFVIGRLRRVFVEKTGYPLLPGGGSGDFPEGTGVVLQSGGKAVLVSVLHGEKRSFRGCSPRGPEVFRLFRAGGHTPQDFADVPSPEKAVKRLLLARRDGVPVFPREGFPPRQETARPPDGEGRGGGGGGDLVGQPHPHSRVPTPGFAVGWVHGC